MKKVLLVFVCVLPAQAQQIACMFGNPRCGSCRDECSNQDLKCEMSMWAAEQIDMGDSSSCQAYVQASEQQPSDITVQQLSDPSNGVPHLGYAITKAVFSASQSNGDFKTTLSGWQTCSLNLLKSGNITGKQLQECMNELIVEKGEPWLEKAACEYVTDGAGTPFCNSDLFKGATKLFNKFINHYFEKPIVHVMGSIEDACWGVAKCIGNWFSGFFGNSQVLTSHFLSMLANHSLPEALVV